MTRKDFQAIATALANSLVTSDTSTLEARHIIETFADGIAHTNPAFKRAVFIKAVIDGMSARCYVEE